MSIERRWGMMALAALPGLGPINLRKLDRGMGGKAEELLEMDNMERSRWCHGRVLEQLNLWKTYFDPDSVKAALAGMGADFVTSEEADYPAKLKPYGDHPIGLYRSRAGCLLKCRCLAVVGTRQPSSYGRKVAREFAAELSRCGFTIISGLAEGIDTEAHRAVLAAGGQTAAVLGGGLKRCYPLSNLGLMAEIEQSAGVWSEFPLWRRADRRSFPQRNRIVSGLSDGVLVIESGSAGGSLITARMASEQGKSVYVIPGRIDSPVSEGCHALIRDGASLVTSVEEILEDLSYLPLSLKSENWTRGEGLASGRPTVNGLTGLEAEIWKLLESRGCANSDYLAGELDQPVSEVIRATMEMELSGHLSKRLDGRYEVAG